MTAGAIFVGCAGQERDPAASNGTVAQRLMTATGQQPLDYTLPARWACDGTPGDVCNHDYEYTRLLSDGTSKVVTWKHDPDAPLDCFFIYPTLDFNVFQAANHEDMDKVALPTRTIEAQAGPFAGACRMFAPYYRQGTFGAYATRPQKEGAWRFRKAFVDVAAAFEHYLREWNDGRPLVIMGHSQGAQMSSYLLHSYFDGNDTVTDIAGSRTAEDLRKRLVVALPIGFNVFVPEGKLVGGSFSDIPLCSSAQETGCVIHYRTYPERYEFEGAWRRGVDDILAAEGLLNRAFDPASDELSCVNPALGATVAATEAVDGAGLGVEAGDIRLVEETWVGSVIGLLTGGPRTEPADRQIPRRYTAACRHDEAMGNYLAIGLYAPAGEEDQRGDPIGIDGFLATWDLGLHLYDFNLLQGDLVEQVRIRRDAWLAENAGKENEDR